MRHISPLFTRRKPFIFEITGKVSRRHSGVQHQFTRLVKDESRVPDELRAFLGRAYNLKAIADYEPVPARTSRQIPRVKQSRRRDDLWNA